MSQDRTIITFTGCGEALGADHCQGASQFDIPGLAQTAAFFILRDDGPRKTHGMGRMGAWGAWGHGAPWRR